MQRPVAPPPPLWCHPDPIPCTHTHTRNQNTRAALRSRLCASPAFSLSLLPSASPPPPTPTHPHSADLTDRVKCVLDHTSPHPPKPSRRPRMVFPADESFTRPPAARLLRCQTPSRLLRCRVSRHPRSALHRACTPRLALCRYGFASARSTSLQLSSSPSSPLHLSLTPTTLTRLSTAFSGGPHQQRHTATGRLTSFPSGTSLHLVTRSRITPSRQLTFASSLSPPPLKSTASLLCLFCSRVLPPRSRIASVRLPLAHLRRARPPPPPPSSAPVLARHRPARENAAYTRTQTCIHSLTCVKEELGGLTTNAQKEKKSSTQKKKQEYVSEPVVTL